MVSIRDLQTKYCMEADQLSDPLLTTLHLCSIGYGRIQFPHPGYQQYGSQNLRKFPGFPSTWWSKMGAYRALIMLS